MLMTNNHKKNYNLKDLNISLFPESLLTQNDLDSWQKIILLFKNFDKIKTVSVNSLTFHNQNCLAYYEVAIALSALNEYLNTNSEKGNATFVVKTGVNSDYFIQIAKLRAIRRLWAVLRSEYNLKNDHLSVY